MPQKKDADQTERKATAEKQPPRSRLLEDVIGKYVMLALGEPGDLLKVDVRALWDDHYRVNVFVGDDTISARVAHSFFLVADGDGTVVTCNPKITRQY